MRFGLFIVFFKQKTAYEMRISDWSSDVCSSDLLAEDLVGDLLEARIEEVSAVALGVLLAQSRQFVLIPTHRLSCTTRATTDPAPNLQGNLAELLLLNRSEEHTSELQSLMRISYAVFCLKKKKRKLNRYTTDT